MQINHHIEQKGESGKKEDWSILWERDHEGFVRYVKKFGSILRTMGSH